MPAPELISIKYQPIMAQDVVFAPRNEVWGESRPSPSSRHLEVSQEEVDIFLTEMTLDTSDIDGLNANGAASGVVFFMQQAVMRVRHAETVTSTNKDLLGDDGDIEEVRGRTFIISDDFVPTANDAGVTTFAPLEQLVRSGEVTDYTAEIVRRTRANGRSGTNTTRRLWPLIDPSEPLYQQDTEFN